MPFRPIVSLDKVRPNRAFRVELAADLPAFALVVVDGVPHAVEDRCTHQDYPLSDGDVRGCDIICPLHGASFDLRTGQPTCGPCFGPVKVFPVRVVDGVIEIDLESPQLAATPFTGFDGP